jgi:hypothetical protein
VERRRVAQLTAAALALVATVGAPANGAGAGGTQIALVHGGKLIVEDLATRAQRVVLDRAPLGPVRWSGDGRLLSDSNRIVGGPTLDSPPVWAPTGATAAYISSGGAVRIWTAAAGSRTIVARTWGARSLAWGADGQLALGRKQRLGTHQEVWVWQNGALRRIAGPLRGDTTPIVAGFAPDGRVLWWNDLFDSGSIRSDGLGLYADTTRIGRTLVFPDFVSTCGAHLVYAQGRDRYTTRGKSIVYDGRDVSQDASRSWVSPTCNGSLVVAAAGRNWFEPRIGRGELRALWQLVPARAQLTHPPVGWTDENPRVLADGSVLFVRTRQTVAGDVLHGSVTEHATLELLAGGSLSAVASLTTTVSDTDGSWQSNYYGHYGWPQLWALSP